MREAFFEQELTKEIAKLAAIPPECVRRDVPLQALGVDSLMVCEIVSFINRRLDRKIGEDEVAAVRTLADLLEWIERSNEPVKVTEVARERLKVVSWVLAGHTIRDAAARYGFHYNTVGEWLRRFQDHGPSALEDRSRRGRRRRWKATARAWDALREIHVLHPGLSHQRLATAVSEQGYELSLSTIGRIIRQLRPCPNCGYPASPEIVEQVYRQHANGEAMECGHCNDPRFRCRSEDCGAVIPYKSYLGQAKDLAAGNATVECDYCCSYHG